MGQRHLSSLLDAGYLVTLSDPFHPDLNKLISSNPDQLTLSFLPNYDVAIFSETANARYSSIRSFFDKSHALYVLTEKPVCSTPVELENILKLSNQINIPFHVNFARRTWPFYQSLKSDLSSSRDDVLFNVNGGAFGLICNGIHYLDLFSWLGEGIVDHHFNLSGVIPSGRGSNFVDHGGSIFLTLTRGRATISCLESSYAPTSISIVSKRFSYIIDEHNMTYSYLHKSEGPDVDPIYLVGKDFSTNSSNLPFIELPNTTSMWLQDPSVLPELSSVLDLHGLIFSLHSSSSASQLLFT